MNVFNEVLVSSQILNANYNSPAVPLVNTYGYCIQAVVSGTPTGTIHLEASADPYKYAQPSPQPPVPTNWDTISGSTFSLSASGVTMWNVTGAFYNYVRVVYVDGSSGASTATVTITVNAKGV